MTPEKADAELKKLQDCAVALIDLCFEPRTVQPDVQDSIVTVMRFIARRSQEIKSTQLPPEEPLHLAQLEWSASPPGSRKAHS